MDHQYIDEHDVAGRYLRTELTPEERDAFQAHLVDCSECADRLLLARLFADEQSAQNPAPQGSPVTPLAAPAPASGSTPLAGTLMEHTRLPLRARIVAYLSPWQLAMLFLMAILLPLGIVSLLFFYELSQIKPGP